MNYGDEDSFEIDYPSYEEILERYKIQGVIDENLVKIALENTMIIELESRIEELEEDKSKLNQKLYDLRNKGRIDWTTYESLKSSNKILEENSFKQSAKIDKLENEIKELNMRIKAYEKLDIDNLKWQIDMQKHRISLLLEKIEELKKL